MDEICHNWQFSHKSKTSTIKSQSTKNFLKVSDTFKKCCVSHYALLKYPAMGSYIAKYKRYYLKKFYKNLNFEPGFISDIYIGFEKHSNTLLHNDIITIYDSHKLNASIQENRFDINTQNLLGQTPLHYAILGNNKAAIWLLINAHARTDIRDCNGDTALHLAIIYDCMDAIKLVINENNVSMLNYAGLAALDLVNKNNIELYTLIKSYGGFKPHLKLKLIHILTRELSYNFGIAKSAFTSPNTLSIIFSLITAEYSPTILDYKIALINYLKLLKIQHDKNNLATIKLNAIIYDKSHSFNLYMELNRANCNFFIFDSVGYLYKARFIAKLLVNIKKVFNNATLFLNKEQIQYSFHGCSIISFNIAKKIQNSIVNTGASLFDMLFDNSDEVSSDLLIYELRSLDKLNKLLEIRKFHQSSNEYTPKDKYLRHHIGGVVTGETGDANPFNNIIATKRKKLGRKLEKFLDLSDLQSKANSIKFKEITGANLLFRYQAVLDESFYDSNVTIKVVKISKTQATLTIQQLLADEFDITDFFKDAALKLAESYRCFDNYVVTSEIEKINNFLDDIKDYLTSPKRAFTTAESSKFSIWMANFSFNLLTNVLIAQNVTTKPIMC